ncbi:MAG: hypothetical protein K6T83_10275 [Alicyclobacillus sp.]|nr:hypothetical protein [Alicyclobacillus sp.]
MEVFFQSYRGEGQLLGIAVPLPAGEVTARMQVFGNHSHWRAHMELVAERLVATPAFERMTFLILPLVAAHDVAWSSVLDRPDRRTARGRGAAFPGVHEAQGVARPRRHSVDFGGGPCQRGSHPRPGNFGGDGDLRMSSGDTSTDAELEAMVFPPWRAAVMSLHAALALLARRPVGDRGVYRRRAT